MTEVLNIADISAGSATETSTMLTDGDGFIKGFTAVVDWEGVTYSGANPKAYIIADAVADNGNTQVILDTIEINSLNNVQAGENNRNSVYKLDSYNVAKYARVWVELDKNTATAGNVMAWLGGN